MSNFDKVMQQKTFIYPYEAAKNDDNYKIYWVNTEIFDKYYRLNRDFYITYKGKEGSIGNRYELFKAFFNNNKIIEVPEVSFSNGKCCKIGEARFVNGRHRYAYMRDMGATRIPMLIYDNSDTDPRYNYSLDIDTLYNLGIIDDEYLDNSTVVSKINFLLKKIKS